MIQGQYYNQITLSKPTEIQKETYTYRVSLLLKRARLQCMSFKISWSIKFQELVYPPEMESEPKLKSIKAKTKFPTCGLIIIKQVQN